jgi:hypothetical protein
LDSGRLERGFRRRCSWFAAGSRYRASWGIRSEATKAHHSFVGVRVGTRVGLGAGRSLRRVAAVVGVAEPDLGHT